MCVEAVSFGCRPRLVYGDVYFGSCLVLLTNIVSTPRASLRWARQLCIQSLVTWRVKDRFAMRCASGEDGRVDVDNFGPSC